MIARLLCGVLILGSLAACGVPVPVITAALGFGTAALVLDDDILKAVEGRK